MGLPVLYLALTVLYLHRLELRVDLQEHPRVRVHVLRRYLRHDRLLQALGFNGYGFGFKV